MIRRNALGAALGRRGGSSNGSVAAVTAPPGLPEASRSGFASPSCRGSSAASGRRSRVGGGVVAFWDGGFAAGPCVGGCGASGTRSRRGGSALAFWGSGFAGGCCPGGPGASGTRPGGGALAFWDTMTVLSIYSPRVSGLRRRVVEGICSMLRFLKSTATVIRTNVAGRWWLQVWRHNYRLTAQSSWPRPACTSFPRECGESMLPLLSDCGRFHIVRRQPAVTGAVLAIAKAGFVPP